MGSAASPWDNAPTESSMGILKRECAHRKTFETGGRPRSRYSST